MDNPEICGIKVNLSLKNEIESEHIKTHFPSLSTFAVLLMQHILLKGESPDDLLASAGVKPTWIFLSSTEYPVFTFLSQSFFCMIEWTFVRINYHYMGLPFLCMLGSLRITGRLLHIFKNPLPDLPLSFPFGSFW